MKAARETIIKTGCKATKSKKSMAITATGSSHDKDNRTPTEQELLKLQKENLQLRMENDVLKQAALIFARK